MSKTVGVEVQDKAEKGFKTQNKFREREVLDNFKDDWTMRTSKNETYSWW